jgi:hypothetical protein
MIASRLFLIIAAGLFLVVFALPLLFAPLTWARWFQWRIPEERDLAVYLGRSLGGVACAICGAAFVAAAHPAEHRIIFDLIAAAGAVLVPVHIWGWLKRVQPWTENAEILLYAALTALAILCRP